MALPLTAGAVPTVRGPRQTRGAFCSIMLRTHIDATHKKSAARAGWSACPPCRSNSSKLSHPVQLLTSRPDEAGPEIHGDQDAQHSPPEVEESREFACNKRRARKGLMPDVPIRQAGAVKRQQPKRLATKNLEFQCTCVHGDWMRRHRAGTHAHQRHRRQQTARAHTTPLLCSLLTHFQCASPLPVRRPARSTLTA